jgi:hypothetical protein
METEKRDHMGNSEFKSWNLVEAKGRGRAVPDGKLDLDIWSRLEGAFAEQ